MADGMIPPSNGRLGNQDVTHPPLDDMAHKTLLARVEELSAVTGDCVAGLLIASERAKDLTTSLQKLSADVNKAHDATTHVAESLAQKLEAISSGFVAEIGVLRADIAEITTKTSAFQSEFLASLELAASRERELEQKFMQEVRDLTAAQTTEVGARLGALEDARWSARSLAAERSRALQLENRYYFWAVLVLLLLHFAR